VKVRAEEEVAIAALELGSFSNGVEATFRESRDVVLKVS
jgi:hypothetical protein